MQRINKGNISSVLIMLVFLLALSILLVSGTGSSLTTIKHNPLSGTPQPTILASDQIIVTTTPEPGQDNLQLRTFTVITLTPQPTPSNANACVNNPFNEEPDIFLGSDPAAGGIASAGTQIRVWVDDGHGGAIAPGEVVDTTTGQIITPGDRTATDGKGPGYYLWEPAIYLTPVSSPSQPGPFAGDVENGGTPHFPVIVKGEVTQGDGGRFLRLPLIDPPVNQVPRKNHGGHIAEFIWDVNALGLAPGSGYYRVQIVVHDGDGDLAINCTTLQI